MATTRLPVEPLAAPVDAEVALPGSKSITNRALLIAALAEGRSVLHGALASDDSDVMVDSLRRLGISVAVEGETFVVEGRGGEIPACEAELFVGLAGTAGRFLTAMVALGRGRYRLDGTERMRQRPMQPLLDALVALGAQARSLAGTGSFPIEVIAHGLAGGATRMRGDLSSQFFSALLLIGPLTRDGIDLTVEGELVSRPFVDLTGAVMAEFGATITHDRYRTMRVAGGQRYRAREYDIEPDASAAGYFFAAAALTGGRVSVPGLGRHSIQGDLAFVDLLARMGCRVERDATGTTVIGPERLRGIETDMSAISDMAMTLAALAPFAEGPTTIRNIAHTRGQESDRIAAMAAELRRLGQEVVEFPDGVRIEPRPIRPATIRTYGDHRMAMAFALVGLRVPGIAIEDPDCVRKTFPGYWQALERLRAARG